MSSDFAISQPWDIAHQRCGYDDHYDFNLQIANATVAMSRCDVIEPSTTSYEYSSSPDSACSYDHPYATSPESPYMTSSYSTSPPDPYQMAYPSPDTGYDTGSSEYYPTKIKDEHTYKECALYNDVTMTSQMDDSNLPSTLDDIKPDLNTSPLPPLSPEDTSKYFSTLFSTSHHIDSCEHEGDLPDDVRNLCQNYLPPIRCVQQQVHQRQIKYEYDRRVIYSDQDSCYCESSDSSSDTPPSTPRRTLSPYRNPCLVPGNNGLFHPPSADRSYVEDSGYVTDEEHREVRMHKKKLPRGQGRNNKLLWQFMVDLMVDPRFRHLADWVDREEGVFRIIQSSKVADMWGKEKGNAEMNYEKMSRALRYYYSRKILDRVDGRRLVYKFGPKSRGWRLSELRIR